LHIFCFLCYVYSVYLYVPYSSEKFIFSEEIIKQYVSKINCMCITEKFMIALLCALRTFFFNLCGRTLGTAATTGLFCTSPG
jgi:hypothetical protein